MLIAEHFFLIACDPNSGLPTFSRRTQGAGQLAAAALLLDLAMQRRLRMRDSLLHADASVPLTHPLLTDVLRVLGGNPLPPVSAMRLVARRLNPLPQHVLDGLFRRDLVHKTKTRRWLFWKQVRYPLRSVQARNEALLSLRNAIHSEDDLHGMALMLLADIAGLLPHLLDAREHDLAAKHLLAWNQADPQADEIRAVFISIRTALLA
jgi:Golgi phosphoprotein 3 GPP34